MRGAQGSYLALYRLRSSPPTGGSSTPVVLTHGTFSNRKIVWPLAEFLAAQGHDCWVYEWANHGRSHPPSIPLTADFHAQHEVPVVAQAVLQATGAASLFWVAHSGGGFLPLMYLARHPEQASKFAGVVGLGTQPLAAGDTLYGRLRIVILWAACHLLGSVPGPAVGLGPESESKGFMLQWARWNWTRAWRALDGLDYLGRLSGLPVPMLAIAGAGDIVAPPQGCRELVEALVHPRSRFVLAGRRGGFREDYDHARLALSSSARAEIWPLVSEWLRA